MSKNSLIIINFSFKFSIIVMFRFRRFIKGFNGSFITVIYNGSFNLLYIYIGKVYDFP